MRKDKRKKGSFFSLLVRNYIFFTIAIVVSMTILFTIAALRIGGILEEPRVDELVNYTKELSNGQYEEIPVERLLGKGGYIEVLDNNNKQVYISNEKTINHQFTYGELECIPSYLTNSYVSIKKYTTDTDEKRTVVEITSLTSQSETILKLYVLDENLNIIYSTNPISRTSFTETEFNYLTGELPSEYYVQKYSFTDNEHNNYTMLIYTPTFDDAAYIKVFRTIGDVFLEFIVIYIVLIGLFIFWLSKKVRKPLTLLDEAIVDFTAGRRGKYLNYRGPKEFVDICDSFNNMSQQLFNSEQKRKKLEEDKQKMLADISHDLKTPITVIKGYSKAICDGLVSDEEKNQYLLTIYQKADGLTELINTFYEYSKMEHPDYSLMLEKQDICEYARKYLAEKYNELYIFGLELEVEIPEKQIFCNIDKIQLKRVFENIISNEIKHNKKGTSVFFTLTEQNDKVKIIIADNGCGIPKEIAEVIFEPFVVGDKSRGNDHGSGLGLAIGKKIVEAHGGAISLVNPPYEYITEFEILLPKIYTE